MTSQPAQYNLIAIGAGALARTGGTPMNFTGRPMRGFVFVSRAGFTREEDLEYWLGLAPEFKRVRRAKRKAVRKAALSRVAEPTRH